MRRAAGTTCLLACLIALGAPAAFAQDAPRREVAFTGGLVGAVSFGGVDATFDQASGAPLVIFRTDNRLAPGFLVEAHIGQRVGRRVGVELTGSWQRADFESRITDDYEDVPDTTVSERSSRFTVEGGALVDLASGSRWSLFVRGTGGWMRELAGSGALVEDGVIANVGAGMKYWWGDGAGDGPRLGLRIEGRASLRSAGLTLGESGWRMAPVVSGGLAIGF